MRGRVTARPVAARQSVAALLSLVILGFAATVRAECDAPLLLHRDTCAVGGVTLRWFHPALYTATISGSDQPYDQPFHVGGSQPDRKVAFRIPIPETPVLIRDVSAYFVAAEGIDSEDWFCCASFVWSIHTDQDGYPGNPFGPATLLDLGAEPDLRFGGWRYDSLDWLLDTHDSAVWLVGSWPDPAAPIVRLGADANQAVLTTLVGCDAGDGTTDWQHLPYPGILLEIATLSCGTDSLPLTDQAEVTEGNLEFTLVGEVVDGPLASTADTAAIPSCSGLEFVDSLAACGQTRRYTVRAVCGGDSSAWVACESLAVKAVWPLTIDPDAIGAAWTSSETDPVVTTLTNGGSLPLTIRVETPIALSNTILATSSALPALLLTADVDSLVIPAGEARSLSIMPLAGIADPGTYTGYIRLGVCSDGFDGCDNHLIPITLRVDAVTAVRGQQEDRPGSRVQPLTVRPLTSPFRDEIRVRVAIDPVTGSLEYGGSTARTWADDRVDMVVYDLLGRERARRSVAVESAGGTELVISGTANWSSGIYLCRVRWGSHLRVVKMLHLR